MKSVFFAVLLFAAMLTGCGYHFEGSDVESGPVTISVPYIKGDPEGMLSAELVKALSSSGQFDCVQLGGMLNLEVAIIAEGDDRIGYRFDRDPTSGHLRDNIVGTENRFTVSADVKLIDTYSNQILIGPLVVKAHNDYDYVDSNSIRDLTFFTPNGTPEKVLDFSLGQLDSIEGAHDDSYAVVFKHLAQKIVDGIIAQSGCDFAKMSEAASEKKQQPKE